MDLDKLIKALMQVRIIAGDNVEVNIDIFEGNSFLPIINVMLLKHQDSKEVKVALMSMINPDNLEKMEAELQSKIRAETTFGSDPFYKQ